MHVASRLASRIPSSLLLALVLPGCSLVLGLGDFREGGTGGGDTGGSGTGGSTTSSSTSTTSTTGVGGGCEAPLTDCSGICVKLDEDNVNCGKCGEVCNPQAPNASTCASSVCKACGAGTADCDGSGTNACEVDLTTDKKNCGACGHACAGTCTDSRCQPVTLASGVMADQVAVGSGYVFWKAVSGAITQAGTDGSNPTPLPISGRFALSSTHVYSRQNDGIWRVPIAGGAAEQFVVTDLAIAVATDATNLYVTTFHDPNLNANVDVTSYDFATKASTPLIANAEDLSDAVPGQGQFFWATSTGLYRASLVLGSAILVASNPVYNQFSLHADASNLFWLSQGAVKSIPIFGADPDTGTKVVQAGQNASALAIDTDNIYWSDGIDQIVRKAPKAGGVPTTLATGQAKALSIAVDDSFVYWVNLFGSAVMKVEKSP